MELHIKLYGVLKEKVSDEVLNENDILNLNLDGKKPATIKVLDVLSELDIKEQEISHVFVNGRYSGFGKEVQNGDRIGLFPRNMAIIFAEIPKMSSIYIIVKLFANLRVYGPPKSIADIPEGSTVKSLIKKIGILEKEGRLIILINGLPCREDDRVLKDGDTIAIFPPLAGG
jgi:molybdopterin converting factor small subunit